MYKTSLIYIFWPWWIGYGQQQQCTYVCTFTKQGKCIYKHQNFDKSTIDLKPLWNRIWVLKGFCAIGCGKVNKRWEGH